MTERYDAIVVGGGPAGSTAAILLARAGWRVAVIERAQFPRRKVCGEYVSASTWPLLMRLGVGERLIAIAGSPVTHVGLFAGHARLSARISRRDDGSNVGRAIGRAELDTALLEHAALAGADVHQPWALKAAEIDAERCRCSIVQRESGESQTLESAIVIDAHGAWEPVALPGSVPRAHRDGDLLGFKAHFEDTSLPAGLMPLLAFPGGYGGMVATGRGRTSLSLCVRRDALADSRRRHPGYAAGDAVLAHIRGACDGVDDALTHARLAGKWIAAGPLATGIRGFGAGRVFAVGNAAAEAHPVIAEGISMAIQSSALLADGLIGTARNRGSPVARGNRGALDARSNRGAPDAGDRNTCGAGLDVPALADIRRRYADDWRSHFAPRLHTAAALAHLFMRPLPTAVAAAVLHALPALLTIGATWSGKSSRLPPTALRTLNT